MHTLRTVQQQNTTKSYTYLWNKPYNRSLEIHLVFNHNTSTVLDLSKLHPICRQASPCYDVTMLPWRGNSESIHSKKKLQPICPARQGNRQIFIKSSYFLNIHDINSPLNILRCNFVKYQGKGKLEHTISAWVIWKQLYEIQRRSEKFKERQ